MGRRTIVLAAVTGMALAGFAQSSAEAATEKKEVPMIAEAPGSLASQTAKDAFDHFFAFISILQSTSELDDASVGRGLNVTLAKEKGRSLYVSPDLGGGWTYVVERLDANAHMKTGFSFGFFNTKRAADPGPICVATLEEVRSAFASRGFAEVTTAGEYGQIVAWNYEKNDIVFSITPFDLATRVDKTQCVRVIHTNDG